jgi:hypothetical protein
MNAPNPNVSPSPVRVEVTAIDATTAPIPTTKAAQPTHHLAELFTKTTKHPFRPPEVATPAGYGEFVRQMNDTSNHLDVLLDGHRQLDRLVEQRTGRHRDRDGADAVRRDQLPLVHRVVAVERPRPDVSHRQDGRARRRGVSVYAAER